MVLQCFACKNLDYRNPKLTFHRLPADANRRKLWLERLNLSDMSLPKQTYICAQHFEKSDFMVYEHSGKTFLKKGAVPVSLMAETEQIWSSSSTESLSECDPNEPGQSSFPKLGSSRASSSTLTASEGEDWEEQSEEEMVTTPVCVSYRILKKPPLGLVKEEPGLSGWTTMISDPSSSGKPVSAFEEFCDIEDMIPEEEIKIEIEEHPLSADMADPLELKSELYYNPPPSSQEHINYCLRMDHTYSTSPNRWKEKYENLMQLHRRLKSKLKSSQKRVCRLLKKIEHMEHLAETLRRGDV